MYFSTQFKDNFLGHEVEDERKVRGRGWEEGRKRGSENRKEGYAMNGKRGRGMEGGDVMNGKGGREEEKVRKGIRGREEEGRQGKGGR